MYLIVFGVLWAILTVLLLIYALYKKYKPGRVVFLSAKIIQYLLNVSMMVWIGITISFIYYFAVANFGGACAICRSGLCNI